MPKKTGEFFFFGHNYSEAQALSNPLTAGMPKKTCARYTLLFYSHFMVEPLGFFGLCVPGFSISSNAQNLLSSRSKRLSPKIQQRERLHLL
jgi:hypothetical protein